MRLRTLSLLFCVLLVAWPAAAQEQSGGIEGVVKDTSGGVLPGVTVEARNLAGGVTTATTDSTGTYRFPALAPGRYDVTAKLQGFAPSKSENIKLELGKNLKVDLSLAVGAVTESVKVTATTPIIAVTQSERSVSLREEQIEKLPKGRDFTSLITQAPGANDESRFAGNVSIDGASGSENRYIIDGMETTQLINGTSGKPLIIDFVDELQVKSSGYTSEYGGSTGGVINVITKSGTNRWKGTVGSYFSSSKMNGDSRPTLRRKLDDSTQAEYITFPKDSLRQAEPGVEFGGPIAKDKVWFFGSYQPELRSIDRTVTRRSDGIVFTRNNDYKRHNSSNNISSQFNDKTSFRVSLNLSPSKDVGLLPSLDGSDPATATYDVTTKRSSYTVSSHLDYVASNKMYVSVRGGYFFANAQETGVPAIPRFLFQTSNIGMAGVPANLQNVTGFASIPTNSATNKDQQTRAFFQADMSYYATWAGKHAFKGGIQVDRIGNSVDSGEQGNRVRLYWGRPFAGQRGPFGHYRVRSNGTVPSHGFITLGDVHSNNMGLFIQDAWTIGDRLTLNYGLRTENEHVPAYTDAAAGFPANAVLFKFGQKLAPRLGAAYDIMGDGKWKAYGNWGVYYDIMKLNLARGSFGGERWLEYYYTLDTPNWPSLITPGCPPACPGKLIRGPSDFRHPSNDPTTGEVDPNMKPMKLQEAQAGLEHQISSNIALRARYVHKQLDTAIEDIGSLDAAYNEIYVIGNPGFGIGRNFVPQDGTQVMQLPKAVRDYDALEFDFDKTFSNNWSLRASYTLSRLYGNYSGLAESDENGRLSPNNGRGFDYPLMMFNQSGQPVYGRLATDRPNQFKTQFVYTFPFGTTVGLNEYVANGVPITREAAVIQGSAYPVQYLGRLSDGRTPIFSRSNFLIQHDIRMGANRRLQIQLNVLNLFDQKIVINRFNTQLAVGEAVDVNEPAFYRGVDIGSLIAQQRIPQDPRFLRDSEYQAPRQLTLVAKFVF
jgi:hypothetical protein